MVSENPIPTHSIFSGGIPSHPFPPSLESVAKAPVFMALSNRLIFKARE
ncbi:MAG: hypothetical protein H8E12_10150 [Rhodobacteraceae bacterium]|nr:hypothetical protein [Paracoccaceae bacterium]